MITRNFNLYLNAGHSVPLVINVNQYDSGEQWVFTLYNSDGTQYTPSTGAIVGIKSDGLGIINSGSVVDGNVVINETQQMTAAVGKAVFELMIDSQTHGTANFIVLVEEKPGNNADLSESDLSLLQEAIDATSPLPTGGTVGQVLTKTANGSAWSDAGTPTQEQVADAVSDWADEHITVETGVVIDTSLAVAGAAADSKKVGDEITDLKSAIQQGGIKESVKQALLQIAQKVAYIDEDGQDYYDALYSALYTVDITSISAVFTQGDNLIFTVDSLDTLKQYLTVTAHYDNGTSAEVTAYTLSGELTAGQSTITVTYNNKTTTFTVNVTEGTDVTPALSAWSPNNSSTINISLSDIGVRATANTGGTYRTIRAYVPTRAGYSYKVSWDQIFNTGEIKASIRQFTSVSGNINNTGTGLGLILDGVDLNTSGHFEDTVKPSDSANWNNSTSPTHSCLTFFVAWDVNTTSDITFNNIKVIEYLAEGDS